MLFVSNNRCCATDPLVKEELEESLQKLRAEVSEDKKIENISKILAGLSHPLRLKMALLLLIKDQCVCELVQLTGNANKPNLVSHHLTILRKSGIVSAYMRANWKYYKLKENIIPILKEIERASK
jgi:DNA-binding transcriptional ArsR family regulator